MIYNGKILTLDTETTGFCEHDRIIQIGSVMKSKGKIYTSEDFVLSSAEISIGAMTAHGIRTIPKNAKKLRLTTTVKRLNGLGKNDIVVGHNIDFDLGMLSRVIKNRKFKVIDTLLIAEYLKKHMILGEHEKLNLQYLRYKWVSEEQEKELIKKHKPNGGAHSALFDSLITDKIAEVLINTLWEIGHEDPIQTAIELYEDRFNPFAVVIPFGKYKGKTVHEVYRESSTYLEWFYNNVDGRDREKKAILILSQQIKNGEVR